MRIQHNANEIAQSIVHDRNMDATEKIESMSALREQTRAMVNDIFGKSTDKPEYVSN
jgi:hypothetical protein